MEDITLILSIIASILAIIVAIFALVDRKNKSSISSATNTNSTKNTSSTKTSIDNKRTIRYYFGMSVFWGLISIAFFLISLYLIKPLDFGEYRKIIAVLMTSLFAIPFILSLIFLFISFDKWTSKLWKQFVNFIKNLFS